MRLHRCIERVGEVGKQPLALADERPLALAIGNFDGVHLGHQAILENARNAASRLGLQASALTFSPLPREFFAKQKGDPALAPARLMSVTEKLAAFQRAGMAHVFMPRFDAKFAAQSPLAFLDSLRAANVRWIIVGEDFRFGAKRAGDVRMMCDYGVEHDIMVETMADIIGANDMRISSSAIREALARSDLALTANMLGRPYAITGRVTHGKKLGRTLGFPTANVSLTGRKPALGGVFAVQCRLVTRGLEGVAALSGVGGIGAIGATETGNVINGVANLGTNPVVSIDNRHHLEVFLFDYSADLYGKRLKVTFIEKIRDELKLPSLDALVTQMHDDVSKAKRALDNVIPT